MKSTQVWFIPVLNPDGLFALQYGRKWSEDGEYVRRRKNTRVTCEENDGGTLNDGVDLGLNFDAVEWDASR